MAAIPEVRLLRFGERAYAASVLLVPRGEEVHGKPFLYNIATDGEDHWSHWGYTDSWQRAWRNVKRVCERHAVRAEQRRRG